MPDSPALVVRFLDRVDYLPAYAAMQDFTDSRTPDTPDEIWLLEHNPVFTQGQAGKEEYLLAPGGIPVVHSDRGGQITYHGPGQITGYLLVDLKRRGVTVRELVSLIERAMVDTLANWGIAAAPRDDAPGVYVANGDKIGSLGLRVRKGCSYHGLNFNVAMDMEPWRRINPCGLSIGITQVQDLLENPPSLPEVARQLAGELRDGLGYNDYQTAGVPELLAARLQQ